MPKNGALSRFEQTANLLPNGSECSGKNKEQNRVVLRVAHIGFARFCREAKTILLEGVLSKIYPFCKGTGFLSFLDDKSPLFTQLSKTPKIAQFWHKKSRIWTLYFCHFLDEDL